MTKKILSIFVLFLSFNLIVSCGSDSKTENTSTAKLKKSKYYNEAIVSVAGDFAGIALNDNHEKILSEMPAVSLVEEQKDYLFYSLINTYTDADYSFILEEDKLVEIDFDAYVFNEEDNYDKDGAILLFNDLKEDMISKYGENFTEEENGEFKKYTWKLKNKKTIELIVDGGEVHNYFYFE